MTIMFLLNFTLAHSMLRITISNRLFFMVLVKMVSTKWAIQSGLYGDLTYYMIKSGDDDDYDDNEVFSACHILDDWIIHNYLLWHRKLGHPSFITTINIPKCNGILVSSLDKTLCFFDSLSLLRNISFLFAYSY